MLYRQDIMARTSSDRFLKRGPPIANQIDAQVLFRAIYSRDKYGRAKLKQEIII
jgi:hypothetical protein